MTPAPVLQLVPLDARRPEPEQLLLRPFYAMRAFALPETPAVVVYGCRRGATRREPWHPPLALPPQPIGLLDWKPRPRRVAVRSPKLAPYVPRNLRPGAPPRVLPNKRLSAPEFDQLLADEAELRADGILDDRPQTFGDCMDDAGPCPWVSCRHHLALEVNPESGVIKINFPGLEVWEMAATCSIKEAIERGEMTLEEVGQVVNLTQERVSQIQESGQWVVAEQIDPDRESES